MILQRCGQLPVADARSGNVARPFQVAPQKIKRRPRRRMPRILPQVLPQQAGRVRRVVKVRLEGDLPVTRRRLSRGGKILVDRLVQRDVVLRPIQQQIAVGRR